MSRIVMSLCVTAWMISAADFSAHGQTPPRGNSSRTDQFGDPLPPDALARFGTIRLRHGGDIMALAFSPDDKVLASAGADGAIRLWDIATGTLRIEIKEPWANRLAFSPDGKTLASGTGIGTIRLRDATTGEEKCRFAEHQAKINALVFSSKGLRLASASADKSARIWDVASGKELQKLTGHEHQVCEVVFAAGDSVVATKSLDNTLRLWDAASGKELRRLAKEYLPALAVSPDGKTLVTAVKRSAVQLLDVTTGDTVQMLPPPATASCFAFSADGKTLVADGLYQWDLVTGKRLPELPAWFRSVTWISPSRALGANTSRGQITVIDLGTGRYRFKEFGTVGDITCLAVSVDGKRIASAGAVQNLAVWDAASGAVIKRPDFGIPVSSLNFTADASSIIAIDHGRVHSIDIVTEQQTELINFRGASGFSPCVISADGKAAAAAENPSGLVVDLRPKIRIWYGKQERPDQEIRLPSTVAAIQSVWFSNDAKTLASSEWSKLGRRRIRLWDCASGNEIASFEVFGIAAVELELLPTQELVLVFSPDNKALATNGRDGTIRLWSAETGRELQWYDGHRDRTTCLAFSPDGRSLVSGGTDHAVRVWEVHSGERMAEFTGHWGPITAVAFFPDGRGLVSASADSTVLSWNLAGWVIEEGQPVQLSRARVSATPTELETRWQDLATYRGSRVHSARWRMVAAQDATVKFLEDRLKGLVGIDNARIARLIADLDADQFATRERATEELERLGQLAEPALHAALEKTRSLEARHRIQRLLEKNKERRFTWPQEVLRALRAIDVLEKIGTPDARALLAKLADGAPEENLKQEAKRSLERLAKTRTDKGATP